MNQNYCFVCSNFNSFKHKYNPIFPIAFIIGGVIPDALNQSVIIGLVVIDVATQIEDRQIQKVICHKTKNIYNGSVQ